MQERKLLKTSILLFGESDGKRFGRTFLIERKLEEGASSVCYEAWHENSAPGVLKEFYPRSVEGLERNADGQLIYEGTADGGREAFEQARKEYMEPYMTMLSIMRESENRKLRSFIPDFEIYYGCEDDCGVTGSVYIWMPRPKLETFEYICRDIQKHPSVKPERKLVTVLNAVKYLTECIQGIHREGLLHRDIKPSNFGFLKYGDDVLEQTLTMFDINSVCTAEHVPKRVMGTEGYMEPEAAYERATNQTDIYAIGATLFRALIVSEGIKGDGYPYEDAQYDRLKKLVDNSMLTRSSEANSHPRLRDLLARILQKCLCEREGRYTDCEALLEDLSEALYYALPTELAKKSRAGERWTLVDVERSFGRGGERNVPLALQYHLYEYPLYRCAEESDIHVLIIGFGSYGQMFLDACLQIGRIGSRALNVTIVSDDIRDMELYLMDRPALPDFFTGKLLWEDEAKREAALGQEVPGRFFDPDEEQEEPYGNIVFQVTRLERDDRKANEAILENVVMYDHCDTNYVFVALGDDEQNLAAAKACRSAVEGLDMQCMVSYVQEWESSPVTDTENMRAVYVNADLRRSARHAEIERMAFNTHLIWEKNLNVDFAKVRAAYRKRYNHDSSVSHVVAVKYWLYGMGLDLDDGCDEAAGRFVQKVSGTEAHSRELRKELIWLEHSRWVTEKVCRGWRPIEDLKICMDGTTKDERQKVHVCIRKSSRTKKSLAEHPDYWEKKSREALRKDLDDLDCMSVELHRAFADRARAVKKKGLPFEGMMQNIRALLGENRGAAVAFNEWTECLVDIWNGGRERVALYRGLRDQFLERAGCLPDAKSIKTQTAAFEKLFYPILASMKYEDYQQTDTDFIDQIPFMLTYAQDACLVIPFSAGGNSEVFKNVAAATLVHPERILYLCFLDSEQDEARFKESVPRIASYMDKRRLRSKIEFVIGCIDYLSADDEEKLRQDVKELAPQRILQVTFLRADEYGLETAFGAYLTKRRKRGRVLALAKNQANLFQVPLGPDFYKNLPSFSFDAVRAQFSRSESCGMVTYIKKKPHLTVDDMFALRCAVRTESHSPEFFKDYGRLWRLYRNGGNEGSRDNKSSVWKALCSILEKYSDDHGEIALFRKPGSEEAVKEYVYIVPSACAKAVSLILKELKENGIAEPGSRLEEYTTNSFRVTILDKYGNRGAYDGLFQNSYALMQPDTISFGTKRNEVSVRFDSLAVKDAALVTDRFGVNGDDLQKMLCALRDMGYVIDLELKGSAASFVYATREIKELLTTEGRLLEVYVYHKLKGAGRFDDIVSGYEVNWEGSDGVKNEWDCLLTCGFRTVFIECKAQRNIDANYYYKLAELTMQFGINPIPVLITDTGDRSIQYANNPRVENNRMQIARGGMMEGKVVTIWKEDEIEHIDETLQKILDGSYKSE